MSRFRQTKMISLRLDLETLSMIDQVAEKETNGNRTWCIENMVEKYFNEWFTTEFKNKINELKNNEQQ
jgi:predicted DNA-binding protein